jgi:hypothetical protein
MDMYLPPRFNPLYSPQNYYDILDWCMQYPSFDKFPVAPDKRFGIAIYQIHQCMDWRDNGVNKYESLAAAVLHFIQTGLALGLYMYGDQLNDKLSEWPREYLENCSLKLLYAISKAQQQIYYGIAKHERGKRRYDKVRLESALTQIINNLICSIPIEFRSECFEKATTIICRELK